jgi:hypothetical protein
MSDQVSPYSRKVMQAFKDYYGDGLYAGLSLNVGVIRDLVPRPEREGVFTELMEGLEFLEMMPAFPGKLILTAIGYHYLINPRPGRE